MRWQTILLSYMQKNQEEKLEDESLGNKPNIQTWGIEFESLVPMLETGVEHEQALTEAAETGRSLEFFWLGSLANQWVLDSVRYLTSKMGSRPTWSKYQGLGYMINPVSKEQNNSNKWGRDQ